MLGVAVPPGPTDILALQRAIGNRAVQRLLDGRPTPVAGPLGHAGGPGLGVGCTETRSPGGAPLSIAASTPGGAHRPIQRTYLDDPDELPDEAASLKAAIQTLDTHSQSEIGAMALFVQQRWNMLTELKKKAAALPAEPVKEVAAEIDQEIRKLELFVSLDNLIAQSASAFGVNEGLQAGQKPLAQEYADQAKLVADQLAAVIDKGIRPRAKLAERMLSRIRAARLLQAEEPAKEIPKVKADVKKDHPNVADTITFKGVESFNKGEVANPEGVLPPRLPALPNLGGAITVKHDAANPLKASDPETGLDVTQLFTRTDGPTKQKVAFGPSMTRHRREPNSIYIGDQPIDDDVRQGTYLGDCYYLAVVMAIANQNPEHLKKMIAASAGQFAANFYVVDLAGQAHPRRVVVPETLAYVEDKDESGQVLLGARFKIRPIRAEYHLDEERADDKTTLSVVRIVFYETALWAPLLEKAFARFAEQYDRTGRARQALLPGQAREGATVRRGGATRPTAPKPVSGFDETGVGGQAAGESSDIFALFYGPSVLDKDRQARGIGQGKTQFGEFGTGKVKDFLVKRLNELAEKKKSEPEAVLLLAAADPEHQFEVRGFVPATGTIELRNPHRRDEHKPSVRGVFTLTLDQFAEEFTQLSGAIVVKTR